MRRRRVATPLQHLMARFFWNRGFKAHSPGLSAREIAEITGLNENTVYTMAARERDAFPPRRKGER